MRAWQYHHLCSQGAARDRHGRDASSRIAPGAEKTLFCGAFCIERLPDPAFPPHAACFLPTRD